jgi:peptidoglycan/xylan/chitin deacetylase (PgdA/CDA1 family)
MSQAYGIMFHHFHGRGHPVVQGSISADDLSKVIEFIGRDRMVSAQEYLDRERTSRLNGEICLTFDDNLKCQFDVAIPVLEKCDLTGFWFVYTSPLTGVLEKLEVYRHFRCTRFRNMEDFYESFLKKALASRHGELVRRALTAFDPVTYLVEFPFYTLADKRFRFLRDDVLGQKAYFEMMDEMLNEFQYDQTGLLQKLWMNAHDLQDLHEAGHVIGMHSHTHPTQMGRLPADIQAKEYRENYRTLTGIIGEPPLTMAHPGNSYNDDTLRVLGALHIELGFRANMTKISNRGRYEHPREDHANIIRRMKI